MKYNTEECKILAQKLGVKPAFLFSCLTLITNTNNYKTIIIPKKDGSKRIIIEPHEKLKKIQRHIVDYIRSFQTEKYCAYGFVKGKSNVQNAHIHVNKKYIYKVDLKDYFPSIRSGRIYKMLRTKPFCFSVCHATVLTNLVCKDNILIQGAPSSPFIANIVTRRLDNSLLKLAKNYKCNYSRYADDMIFSTDLSIFPIDMTSELISIIQKEMFIINDKKTKLLNQNMRQVVTGIVVNKKLNLKREYYRKLRIILHTWITKGLIYCSQKNNMSEQKLNRYILGKIAYYKSVVGIENDCYLRLCSLYNEATNTRFFNVPIAYKLSHAVYILKGGSLKAAGSVAGDILEEFLKSLCIKNNIF